MSENSTVIGSAQSNEQEREEELSLLQTITMEVAAASDLSSALEVVLRRVCEKTGWTLGQAWVPNPDGTTLDSGPAWLSDPELQQFRDASKRAHFTPGIGLPGRVWQSRQPAWIDDVRHDPNFPRLPTAKAVGLQTAVGIPILSQGKVIAVVEFFIRESRRESERLVAIIMAVATQL